MKPADRQGFPGFCPSYSVCKTSGDKGQIREVNLYITMIEPTAIRLGLPVCTDFRYKDIDGLQHELTKPRYQKRRSCVAWEHCELDRMVRNFVGAFGGNPADVPKWPDDDYDSLYILRISDAGAKKLISFSHDHEGLTHLSSDCP
jgi:hypothetical protein